MDYHLPRIPERRADDHLRYLPALSLIWRDLRLASLEGRSCFSDGGLKVRRVTGRGLLFPRLRWRCRVIQVRA